MEDDSFFLEDRFSTFDRDLKNKKITVPMNPEGVHGQPLGLPTISLNDSAVQAVGKYVGTCMHAQMWALLLF